MSSSYGALCAEFYDLDKPRPPADALDFYLSHLQRAGGPALELMCGSGRFLVPMLERALRVDGVDASPAMLGACRERCRARNLSTTLFEQHVEALALPARYRLAFIAGSSFSLLADPRDAAEALRRIHRCLLPGGVLILEAETPAALNGATSGVKHTRRADGGVIRLHWRSVPGARPRLLHFVNRYELWQGDSMETLEHEQLSLRLYDEDELAALLRANGYNTLRVQRSYQPQRAAGAASGLIIECQKNAGAQQRAGGFVI